MSYDPNGEKFVLFGGRNDTESDETWTFDYASDTWDLISTTNTPPPSWQHSMVFDSNRDLFILFGPYNGTLTSDTYELILYEPDGKRSLLLQTGSPVNLNAMGTLLLQHGQRYDIMNVTTSTPSLEDLAGYRVVISWSNTPPPNNNTEWG